MNDPKVILYRTICVCVAVIMAVVVTKSAWCLWGLVFMGDINFCSNNEIKSGKLEDSEFLGGGQE